MALRKFISWFRKLRLYGEEKRIREGKKEKRRIEEEDKFKKPGMEWYGKYSMNLYGFVQICMDY